MRRAAVPAELESGDRPLPERTTWSDVAWMTDPRPGLSGVLPPPWHFGRARAPFLEVRRYGGLSRDVADKDSQLQRPPAGLA